MNTRNSGLLVVLFSVVALFLFTGVSTAAIYFNVSISPVIQPGALINITGSVANTTTTDTTYPINITANTTGGTNSSATNSSTRFFSFLVTAPTTIGPYNISISTNSSSLMNKTLTMTVANELVSGSSIIYSGKYPPFTAGTTFTVNITLKNNTAAVSGITPNVSVYAANGVKTSWTIANNSASTNLNGLIQYNITVPPGTSSGTYVIVVDGGVLYSAFEVGSGYVVAVQTLTSLGEISSFFPPSSALMILSKVRDSSGTPVTGATVSAVVTYPNGSVSSPVTLTAHPSSSGYYNNTFSDTSASGSYKVKVTATISGTNVISSGIFNTQRFTASLQPQQNFFFEWGGQGSFKPNSVFALDIVAINLTDGSTIAQSSCPSSAYNIVDVTYANGTSILTPTVYNYSFVTSISPSGTVCAIKFGNVTGNSNISDTGVYNAKVNVTIGGESHTISGFFSVQNYFLKIVPILSLGGEDDFMQVVAPGSNITIALKAVNTSNEEPMLPQNITGFSVTSILPLEFTSGTIENTNITQINASGVNPSTDPLIYLTLPTNTMGPLLIKVQANVTPSNITVTGDAFVIANYLMGGISPKGISVGGEPGGPGGGPSGEGGPGGTGGMLCSGTKQFDGTVQDATTGIAAQGATVVGIIQAREDETGKDVSSYLTIRNATASTSAGAFSVNITFAPTGYSFSGNYFMALNATYKNVSAAVPGFFQCKNLNIGYPEITTVGSTSSMGFFVSPTSGINVTLSNVTNMTGSLINGSSTLSIMQIYNFNPGSGAMKILTNNTPLTATFTNQTGGYIVSNSNLANMSLYPQNFSIGSTNLTQWPNGFFDIRLRVDPKMSDSTPVVDTSHGGFQVVAFNAFPETFGFSSVSAGSVATTIIDIQANGSFSNIDQTAWNSTLYTISNNTFINMTIGRPWEGDLTSIYKVNASLLTPDGWNYTANSTFFGGAPPFERWNITYEIPATAKKGFAMLTITVNATTNGASGFGQVDIPLALTVTKYNVVLPSQEGVGDQSGGSTFDGYWIQYYRNSTEPWQINQTAFGSWDVDYLYTNYKLNSSGGHVCVKNQFNSTRYGSGQSQQILINSTTKLLVLDNATAGTFDTIVLNMTNGNNAGTIAILNTAQRNATVITGTGGLYLWQIDNCGYFTVINSTKDAIAPQGSFAQNFGGSHQKNTNFTIPYVISLGSATSPTFQSGANVGIKGVGQQNPGKNGGFGFTGKLTGGTDYTTGNATTDANGVAFVTLNVSRSGNFMAFWNVTLSGDTDAADFSSATFFESRAFDSYTNTINNTGIYRVVLYNNVTGHAQGGALVASDGNYNGTASTSDGILYVEYSTNASDKRFAINFGTPTSSGSSITSANQSLNIGGSNYRIAWITPNITTGTTSTNNQTMLIYKSDNFQSGVISVVNATQNITISICGQAFGGNPPVPLSTMQVNNITSEDWSQGGTIKTLTIYELMNNTNITGIGVYAGPTGCTLLNVGPGQLGAWPSVSSVSGGAPPVFVNGYVTNGADSQQIYVANIFRTG